MPFVTVQIVLGEVVDIATDNPDAEVAKTANGAVVMVFAAMAVNVIVCVTLRIVTVLLSCGAAEKFAFPAWFAVMMQLPAINGVNVLPVILQMPVVVVANVTTKAEEAVEFSANGIAFTNGDTGAANVMVWFALVIVMLRESCGAAE